MIIRIGKASDNDFVVNDPHVSRYHAKLIREEGDVGYLKIWDRQTEHLSMVPRSLRSMLLPAIRSSWGDNYVLNISEALKSNNDYSEEFAALKQVYDNYIQAKVKIQSSNQFKTRLFQSLPFALPGVVGVVIGFLGKGSPELFGLSLFITICAQEPSVSTWVQETVGQDPTVAARSDQSIQNRLCLPQMRNVFG